jgi:hypothetical protein
MNDHIAAWLAGARRQELMTEAAAAGLAASVRPARRPPGGSALCTLLRKLGLIGSPIPP